MERLYHNPPQAFPDKWRGWAVFLGNGKEMRRTPEEWVSVAEALTAKHGGVLPCRQWLEKNNYSGISRAMRRCPELFKHVPQDNPHGHHKSPEEWVPLAEALTAKHGGVLPCRQWLEKNDYIGLVEAMRRRPELFKHIPQDKPYGYRKSPEDWIKPAEALTAKQGGILPCGRWLRNNNYAGLDQAIKKRPELFKHIPQDKRGPGGRPSIQPGATS